MEHTHVVWYKDGATVVASAALVVSLLSWLISLVHTRSLELSTAHEDLIVVILATGRENIERAEKYSGNKPVMSLIDGMARQEINVLAAQSAKSARMLGPKRVVSAEYMTIARAQEEAGDFESQGYFVQKAVETAKTNNDKRNALFDSANYFFKHRGFEEGRREFRQFLEVLRDNDTLTQDEIADAAVGLHLAWAGVELQRAGDLNAANAQLQAAADVIQGLSAGPFRQALQKSLDDFVQGGSAPTVAPAVPPPAGTAPANVV
jgi:hypothetical protein